MHVQLRDTQVAEGGEEEKTMTEDCSISLSSFVEARWPCG